MEHAASRCEPGGEHRIALGGVLDHTARRDILTEAAALRFCEHDVVTVDLRAVEAVDTDGLEALAKVVGVADSRDGTVVAVGATDDVRLALELAELGDALLVLTE